jgi:hypothetical protein
MVDPKTTHNNMYFSNKEKQDIHIEMSEQFPRQFLQYVPNGLNAQIFLHNLRGKNPLLTEREGQNRHRQLPTSAHKCRGNLLKFIFLPYLFLSLQQAVKNILYSRK